MNPYSSGMAVIARSKLSGLGEHWGVLLSNYQVAHCTHDRNAHVVPFDEFAQGRQIKVIREIPWSDQWAVNWRLQTELAASKPYNVVHYNCEIFANSVAGFKPESPQVNGWAILGFGLFAARLLLSIR